MEDGIHPREASDRLNIYQARFDELWRKYTTYSGGEELFGLSVTQYPELQRIRKELNLLQKLYQLYNIVLENVNGYQDIPWVEIDIEKINNELLDFGNKYVLKELVDTEAVPLKIIFLWRCHIKELYFLGGDEFEIWIFVLLQLGVLKEIGHPTLLMIFTCTAFTV